MSFIKCDTVLEEIKLMCDMKPFEVGKIIQKGSEYNGHIVMRTASTEHFEVMDFTLMSEGACWTSEPTLTVRLLKPGENIEMILCND